MSANSEKHYLLSETNWKFVKGTDYQLAVLPWGATEAHNYHLPYSTDNLQCSFIAEKAANKIWKEGYRVMVLPCVPFGVQSAQLKVKFNINMRPSTQLQVLKDIVESLEKQDMNKLLIMNGHGGNNFVQMIRELYLDTKVRIFTLNWYDCVNKEMFFDEPGDHAGELETSTLMHIAPHLVSPLEKAGNGKAKKIKINSLHEGLVWTQRGWLNEVTVDTGVGDPRKATAQKGKLYLDAVIEKVSKVLKEIADVNLKDFYE